MEKPLIQIGWVVTAPLSSAPEVELTRDAAQLLETHLADQFEGFNWSHEVIVQRIVIDDGKADPLDLLKIGVAEKIERRWDFALVVSAQHLMARSRPYTLGIPSSALETAVLSTAPWSQGKPSPEPVAAMAQFLLGHLLGLETREPGAMAHPSDTSPPMQLARFSKEERSLILPRLEGVGDERLEERPRHRFNGFGFALRTFLAEPRGILRDVAGYHPWIQPFRIPKITAASLVSLLLLFLGAESWELGTGMARGYLVVGALVAVLGSAGFLYLGQNLSQISKTSVRSEQLTRSRLVLFFCQFLAMLSLWILLFAASFGISSILPRDVVEGWLSESLNAAARASFSAFAATLATLAGALGGNMESEEEFKAEFFFDEEY